jgi:hypothetical protein
MSLPKPTLISVMPADNRWQALVPDEESEAGFGRLPVIAWRIETYECSKCSGEFFTIVVPVTVRGDLQVGPYVLEYDRSPPFWGEFQRFDTIAEFVRQQGSTPGGRR